ncbi:MAG TPA: hypothetical protein VE524_01410 [Nitrososphaeraceae archaeon]|jgi:hypothetical protein|nr:hypothetical protein [Nitrososphaeraceae archaeon]
MVNTLKNKQVYHNILFKNKNILSNRTEEENYKVIDLDPNELIFFEYDSREKKYDIKNTANNHYNNIILIVPMQ